MSLPPEKFKWRSFILQENRFLMRKAVSLLLVGVAFLGLALFSGYKVYQGHCRRVLWEKRKTAWERLRYSLENKITNFNGSIGMVIKDLDTNWEIDFNKEVLFPAASLSKIPILLSYFYAAKEGKVNLDDFVCLRPSQKVAGSKVLGDMPAGSVFSVEELFGPMITISDNTATNILIDYLGFDALNGYFTKLGLKNTSLSRKMMAFEDRRKGKENYTTAEDMSYLLEMLYHENFMNKDVSGKCLEFLKQQRIKDRIPKRLPPGVVVAHKTGLENHICHDVGIVFTRNGNFLICILARHKDKIASPAKRLISDIALLTYNYYQNLN